MFLETTEYSVMLWFSCKMSPEAHVSKYLIPTWGRVLRSCVNLSSLDTVGGSGLLE